MPNLLEQVYNAHNQRRTDMNWPTECDTQDREDSEDQLRAACVSDSAGFDLLDKAAYIGRYAIKLQELLGIDADLATQSAEASFEDWDGVYTPEEAADDEAGYWAADI